MRKCSLALLLLLPLLPAWGCATPRSDIVFLLKSVALQQDGNPSADGTFIVRDFRIEPKEIRIVVGDIHLRAEDPVKDLEIFDTLAPLVTPGQEVQASQIGNNGRFPGLWAVNLTPGAEAHRFAAGKIEAGSWKSIRLRFSPGVTGVRGLTSEDLRGNTVLFNGDAQKGQTRCSLSIRVPFEGGFSQRIDLTTEIGRAYQNTIQVDVARWFKDIPMDTLCTQGEIKINNTDNPQVASQIKDAVPSSFSFQFGSS